MCEGHQRQQRLPQVVHVTCLCPPRPKGDHLDVKAVGESGSAVQQCFVAFDVLLVDGQNLANRPQQERADILSTWVEDCNVEMEGWGGWIQIHGLAMCTNGCLEVTSPCKLCELVYHVMQWMLCAPCRVRCDGHVVQLCD